ncbi:MAG: hypothetical protein WKG07_43230 [Hymenobacter sp.]
MGNVFQPINNPDSLRGRGVALRGERQQLRGAGIHPEGPARCGAGGRARARTSGATTAP